MSRLTCSVRHELRLPAVNGAAREEGAPLDDGAHRGCVRTADICPGTRYLRVAGKWDGDMFSESMCLRCARLLRKAMKRYPPVYYDEGPAFGELLEYLRQARR